MSWRDEAKAAIRRYPQHVSDDKELKAISITAAYTGSRGSHEASRTTELAALKQLPPDEQRELDAVDLAIRVTEARYYNAPARMRLIRLMYWGPRPRQMIFACRDVPCHYQTAAIWHTDFIGLVDAYLRPY